MRDRHLTDSRYSSNPRYRTAKWLLLSIAVLFGGCVSKTVDPAKPRPVLRLGVGNYYFWNIVQDGQFSGAVVDIWREIAGRNNLEIEFVRIESMDHLKTAMEDGSIDAFCSVRKTPERAEYMLFIEPPFRTKLEVLTYVKAGSGVSIARHEDMHGRKVALVDAGYDRVDLDPNVDRATIGWNPAEAFDMLLAGTVDAVHINQWRAMWHFHEGEHKDPIALADYVYREYHPCYLVMAKRSALAERWKDLFGQTVQHMIDDGTMKRIVDSYVPGWYEYYLP